MKKIAPIVLVFVLGCSIAMWLWPSPAEENEVAQEEVAEEQTSEHLVEMSEQEMNQLGIKIQKAGPANLTLASCVRGKVVIQPDKMAHIVPRVSGIAKEIKKNIGDRVMVGELLAVFESPEMAESKANFLAALQKEQLAQSIFEREEKLQQRKISAESDYLQARSQYEEAKINLLLTKHKLYAYGLSDQEITNLVNQSSQEMLAYELRAPITGEVTMRDLTQGEFVESMATIFEIVNLDQVWLELGVFPKDLLKIHEGQDVEVCSSFDRSKITGKLIYVSPMIKAETITTKAIAQLDNRDGLWRPGSLVKANILTENIHVPLALPKESIQEIEGNPVAFVKTEHGFAMRAVRTGRSDAKMVEIVSGLNENEDCAISETFVLKAELGKDLVEDDD